MPRPHFLLGLLIAAALRADGPPSLLAQEVAVAASASRDDSLRALRTARGRQAAFERVRRGNLPYTWGGGSGWCDERIGRFCLTYSSSEGPEWMPPEEKQVVVRARQRLLGDLAEAAMIIPGDAWVTGQRVRYLVESGEFGAALAAARRCRAERWWCDALGGFAAHHAGRSAEAQQAYDRALEAMPEGTRREWTDLTPLLEPGVGRRYRRLGEGAKEEFERRFWGLATPLHQSGGNDLRSEHLSRNLLVSLQDRSETTEDLPWGDDLREILLRFGAPTGWERIRHPHLMHTQALSLVSHYPDADLDLLPPAELLADEFDPMAGEWDESGRRARASYPLPRGGDRLRWLTPFDHQFALLHDADSALLVAAYSLPADSIESPDAVRAALTTTTRPGAPEAGGMARGEGVAAALTLRVPYAPQLVSLEALSEVDNRAARARRGITPRALVPGVLAASDLLLLTLQGEVPAETRAEALPLARGSSRVAPGERFGVYWEMYSPAVPWPDAVEVSLRLVQSEAGWLRRLGRRVGIVAEVQPVRMTWDEATRGSGTISRSLALQVPEDARPGAYSLELTLSAPGREPLTVSRNIEITP